MFIVRSNGQRYDQSQRHLSREMRFLCTYADGRSKVWVLYFNPVDMWSVLTENIHNHLIFPEHQDMISLESEE